MKLETRLEKEVQENKKLYKFLMKNKAYDKFMSNTIDYIKDRNLSEGSIIDAIRREEDPILYAFTWVMTSEGSKYWSNLYEAYKHLK